MQSDKVELYWVSIFLSVVEALRQALKLALQMAGPSVATSASGGGVFEMD